MARRAVRFLHKKGIGPLGEPALPFIKMDCSIGVMGKGTFRRNCLNLIQETERVINSAKSVQENCGRSFSTGWVFRLARPIPLRTHSIKALGRSSSLWIHNSSSSSAAPAAGPPRTSQGILNSVNFLPRCSTSVLSFEKNTVFISKWDDEWFGSETVQGGSDILMMGLRAALPFIVCTSAIYGSSRVTTMGGRT